MVVFVALASAAREWPVAPFAPGMVQLPDGSVLLPNGYRLLADGTMLSPEGTILEPNAGASPPLLLFSRTGFVPLTHSELNQRSSTGKDTVELGRGNCPSGSTPASPTNSS